MKSSTDDQALPQGVNEVLKKTTDGEIKEIIHAEKCVATDFDCSDRHLSIEDYNNQIASLEKAIEAQNEVIQKHSYQLAAIEKILQTEFSQDVKVSDEHQKTGILRLTYEAFSRFSVLKIFTR